MFIHINSTFKYFKMSSDSAIFCTSGEQAAKRAAEGFDMVGVFYFTLSLKLTHLGGRLTSPPMWGQCQKPWRST